MVDLSFLVHQSFLVTQLSVMTVVEGDVSSEYGSVVRPQVPQYVTLQILAILQPYPQERDTRDQCISSDIGEIFTVCQSMKAHL